FSHGVEMRQRMTDGVDDCRDHRIWRTCQAIVDPETVASCLDETRSSEVGEVSRRLRLRNLQALVNVADADLAGEQQPENAEARLVCEGLEDGFHRRQLFAHICVLTDIARCA